jgi:hypothetical protein
MRRRHDVGRKTQGRILRARAARTEPDSERPKLAENIAGSGAEIQMKQRSASGE